MTDPSYTHFIFIIDRSGSMFSIAGDASGGIRNFAREQAALPGTATLSLYDFDSEIEKVFDFDTLDKAESYTLVPRGMTRLLDAIGVAVTEEGKSLAAMEDRDRPGKVIVLIVTDGEENASKEFELEQVKRIVTQQREQWQWEFSFIGANIDSFAVAGSVGIAAASVSNYEATSTGTRKAYSKMSLAASAYRGGAQGTMNYTVLPPDTDDNDD